MDFGAENVGNGLIRIEMGAYRSCQSSKVDWNGEQKGVFGNHSKKTVGFRKNTLTLS
jgi:hypothetical protein